MVNRWCRLGERGRRGARRWIFRGGRLPRAQVKSLRVGDARRERSRYPQRVNESYGTGWLFAGADVSPTCVWCDATTCPGSTPTLETQTCFLGAAIPEEVGADAGSWANVFGTGEADVLNQLVKIESASSKGVELALTAGVHLNQRFWIENVRGSIGPGQFYYDAAEKTVSYAFRRAGFVFGRNVAATPRPADLLWRSGGRDVDLPWKTPPPRPRRRGPLRGKTPPPRRTYERDRPAGTGPSTTTKRPR